MKKGAVGTKMWETVKMLERGRSEDKTDSEALSYKGELYVTPRAKAETFARYYAIVLSLKVPNQNEPEQRRLAKWNRN